MKYLNGPDDGWIGPHMSPWILSRKLGLSSLTLVGDGRVISFPKEHAEHGRSFLERTLRSLRGCPVEFSIIRRIIETPG